MELDRTVCFVFFFYCLTVGTVLLVLPWTAGWDVLLSHLPHSSLRVLAEPLARGAVSGFGLVHFVWGVHDLAELLRADLGRAELERRGGERRH